MEAYFRKDKKKKKSRGSVDLIKSLVIHGHGTQCTKMGADSLAKNTPNAPEFSCPISLPKPKSSGFQWKK